MVIDVKLIDKIISKKRNIFLFLLLLAIISSITLFLIPNMSRGHDLTFHLSRILAIKDNLKLGIIGGSIYPNYLSGYGYANPLFYPDIFLYIPAALSYLGISIIDSYKIFLFLINIASICTMYISVKGITKNKKTALIGAIVYGFASYRLVDMFTRAALGETLAFIFAPLVIYGMYEIIYDDYKKFYILVIGMTGLILSHLISTYLIGIVLVIMCLLNIKKLFKDKKRISYLVIAALITVLLTSYFVLPMLEQMISGKFSFNDLSETSKLLKRALPIWSIFIEFPFHILSKMWIPSGIGIGFLILVYYYIKSFKKCSRFVHFCFISSIVFLLCATNLFPWNLFQGILSPIQFPWRFYLIAVVLLSIGGSVLLSEIKIDLDKQFKKVFLVCLIPVISVVIVNFCEINVKDFNQYEISFGEYMPSQADKKYILARGDVITTNNPLVHSYSRNGLKLNIKFSDNTGNNNLELPLLYYKGYVANLNGQKIDIYETNNGLVGLDISQESGTIIVNYAGTSIQCISKIISFITLLTFISILIIKKRGDNYEK